MKPINIARVIMRRIYQTSGLRVVPDIFTGDPVVENPLGSDVWVEAHWMSLRVWHSCIVRLKMPLYLNFVRPISARRETLVTRPVGFGCYWSERWMRD